MFETSLSIVLRIIIIIVIITFPFYYGYLCMLWQVRHSSTNINCMYQGLLSSSPVYAAITTLYLKSSITLRMSPCVLSWVILKEFLYVTIWRYYGLGIKGNCSEILRPLPFVQTISHPVVQFWGFRWGNGGDLDGLKWRLKPVLLDMLSVCWFVYE